MNNVWVIVPTYNERENVESIADSIFSLGMDVKLLFVDDSSPDGTADRIKDLMAKNDKVNLIVRPYKKGIGSAYLEGFKNALQNGCECAVTIDADMQHPPEKIPELVKSLSKADVVIGSRYVQGGEIEGWGLARRLISKIANSYSRYLLGLEVRDCTSGFRVYNRRSMETVLKNEIKASGFEFQVITLSKLKKDARFAEVPYIFKGRKKGKSKLLLRDIVKFFFSVLWEAL
jgi:dolichol-phosphate mannosyltransferase